MRTAMRQMFGVFAQLERGMIRARMEAGRRLKAERGGYTGSSPALGVRAEGKALVVDRDEADIVDRMVALRAARQSLREIGAVLEAEGRTTKRGAITWPPSTVGRALARAGVR